MAGHEADVTASVECDELSLKELVELAERVDIFVGADPPPEGYGLAEAFSAVLNGGTAEEIQAAFSMAQGWNFQPQGGWPYERKEPNGE
jgi:hypothetical protein